MSGKSTVLVADDSELIRAIVRAGLEDDGYQVSEAADGLAALEHCLRSPPDVVLLDIEMPGLDGHRVLAQLKANELLRDIPVVFLTGHTDMSDVLNALRAGAQDYLKKPFEPAELLARVGAAAHIKRLQDELRARNAELERLSRTDMLTGLDNRRHIEEQLRQQSSAARRHREEFAVLLFDIDHFKRVNDTYGHPTGDLVLREFAHRLRGELRAEDIACRWGGEEFLIVLPHTGPPEALAVAERIRSVTESTPILAGDQLIGLTVSGGCAIGSGGTPEDLIREADSLLYRAKQDGRNRIAGAA
jgi:two-component system, cell cycle response regulator